MPAKDRFASSLIALFDAASDLSGATLESQADALICEQKCDARNLLADLLEQLRRTNRGGAD